MATYYYVYILHCSDDSYYTGMTSDLDKRIIEHNSSKFENAYTSTRRPVTLVWSQLFQDYETALFFEKKIKGWSRLKKQALINDDFEKLPFLSLNKRNRDRE